MTYTANIRLLMWVYVRSFINGLIRGDTKSRMKNIGMLVSKLGAFAIFYFFFRYMLLGLSAMSGAGPMEISAITSTMIHAIGAALLLGAIKFAYQVFYLSTDLEWLLSSPLPLSRIFVGKFIENWLYGGNIVFSFGWPIATAYGTFNHAPLAYYPIALIATAFLAIYTGAIGVLVCLPLMRYIRANRLREVLLTLSMGLTIGLYVLFRNVSATLEGRDTEFNPVWLPTSHLGQILKHAANAEWSDMFAPLAIYVLPAVAIAFLAYLVSLRLYMAGLQQKTEAEGRIRARAGEGLIYRLAAIFPPDIRSVMVKDVLETIRSPRQWFYLIFAIVFLGFQFTRPGDYGPPMVHLLLLLFIVSIFSQELTILALAREGDMFALVAVGGISAWRLFAAKWLVAFVPTLSFALIAGAASGIFQGQTTNDIIIDLFIIILGIIPLISYSLGIGCMFPDFKTYRSRQRISPWVLILNMVFMLLMILLIMMPLYFVRAPISNTPNPAWVNIALIALSVTSAISITAVSFALASIRLRRFLNDVPVS